MLIKFILLLLLFILLLIRILQIGGLSFYENDPELEEISYKFEDTRRFLAGKVETFLPQPQSALLEGMVLGIKEDMPAEFKKALKETSTMHIVVVSGQNLTLLSGLIMNVAYIFGRKKSLILTLAAIIFYACLTGLQTPVIRAAIMVLFASAAQFFGREQESWWILTLTALIMLTYQPNWLLSVSFQLSFLATIGVVIVAPELIKKLKFIPDIIRQDLGVSIAAQAMVLPIIASNFHQISIVGIVVNSFILWTVPLIMAGGLITLILSVISQTLGQVAIIIPGIFLTYIVYIVEFFNTNWSSIYIGNINYFFWFGYYLLVAGLFLLMKQTR